MLLSFLESSPPGGVLSYVNCWHLWLLSYFRPRLACPPECLLSSVCLKRIQLGSCYTQLFQFCLICPIAIPRPPHPSPLSSFIIPPSWAPFLPPSIRSITELWLSHFNITSGCNPQCLISLLKRDGIIEIHFSSHRHPHGVTRWGPAQRCCVCDLRRKKRGHVMGGRAHYKHLLVIIQTPAHVSKHTQVHTSTHTHTPYSIT